MDFFPGLKSWKWLVPIFVILALFLYLFAGDPFGTRRKEQKDKIGFIILGDINEPGWNAGMRPTTRASGQRRTSTEWICWFGTR